MENSRLKVISLSVCLLAGVILGACMGPSQAQLETQAARTAVRSTTVAAQVALLESPESYLGPVPSGAYARLGKGPAYNLHFSYAAWSPDEERLASVVAQTQIVIWDVQALEPMEILQGHLGTIRGLSWSPDGSLLASSSEDRSIAIWEPESGERLHTIPVETRSSETLAWSPDSSRFAWDSAYGGVRIVDTHTWQELPALGKNRAGLASLTWSPDGTRLASVGYDGIVIVWDLATGDRLHSLDVQPEFVMALSWTEGGLHLATRRSVDSPIVIWDVLASETFLALEGSSRRSSHIVAWSPDGMQITASMDNPYEIVIWNAENGRQTHALHGHDSIVGELEWSPTGTWLASASTRVYLHLASGWIEGPSNDDTLVIWDLTR